jgi:antitoxin ParD1/3/4
MTVTHQPDPIVAPSASQSFENLMPNGPHPAILAYRHNLSYYEAMPMTSLNISLPEALKEYVERQVATGDWGTPSEYVRELIRQDKERRLVNLEQELLAAAKGPKIEIPLAEIRRKGLISALRAALDK